MKKNVLILLLVVTIALAGCNVSFSTANITKGTMSTGIEGGAPIDTVEVFAQDAPALYVFGFLNNAPPKTTITFVWSYVTEQQKIGEFELITEDESGLYVYGFLTNDGLIPVGDYKVEIYVNDRTKADAVIEFSVE